MPPLALIFITALPFIRSCEAGVQLCRTLRGGGGAAPPHTLATQGISPVSRSAALSHKYIILELARKRPHFLA